MGRGGRPEKKIIIGLAKRLKRLLIAKNFSSQKTADELGVDKRTVCNWLNGSTEPSLYMIREVAVICGVTVDSLLGLEALLVEIEEPEPKRILKRSIYAKEN